MVSSAWYLTLCDKSRGILPSAVARIVEVCGSGLLSLYRKDTCLAEFSALPNDWLALG